MTDKKFKVWDENNWGQLKWVKTRLEQLEYQASQLGGYSRNYVYRITTPIPPILASQQEHYSMVQTVTRYRFSKEIAEELIAEKGDFAHFYALEKLGDYQSEELKTLWRDVLIWLDELKGETK